MVSSYNIRAETPADFDAVHALHNAAFGGTDIPDLVADLRAQVTPLATVSLVAETAKDVPVGHVMASYAQLDTDTHLVDVMVLSPLGVHPTHQGNGAGTALLHAARTAADNLGSPLLFLEGNHRYYGPRGFENANEMGFRRPSTRIPPKAFQVAKLSGYDPAMTGTLVYKDVHWRHGVGLYMGA